MQLQLKQVYSSLIKKVLFVVVFFSIAPITLVVSFFSLRIINTQNSQGEVLGVDQASYGQVRVYSPRKTEVPSVSGEVILKDARPEILRKYMRVRNSPLEDYAEFIVEVSDQHGLDYRLLTAIAQKESGICRVIPEDSYNCWGWGIHSKGTLRFDNYEQAIQTVARGLKKEYIDKGYVSIEEIMSKWVPHSPEGVWAKDVQAYMDELI
ncbi:hypothetical protein ACFL2C_04060 [Patescibacteria group bacterium]